MSFLALPKILITDLGTPIYVSKTDVYKRYQINTPAILNNPKIEFTWDDPVGFDPATIFTVPSEINLLVNIDYWGEEMESIYLGLIYL